MNLADLLLETLLMRHAGTRGFPVAAGTRRLQLSPQRGHASLEFRRHLNPGGLALPHFRLQLGILGPKLGVLPWITTGRTGARGKTPQLTLIVQQIARHGLARLAIGQNLLLNGRKFLANRLDVHIEAVRAHLGRNSARRPRPHQKEAAEHYPYAEPFHDSAPENA
ncbi:MAG: hypothetical protein IIB57_11235 [Planctomycetes bacterium]|nr:hypothetical protein [Planctomycetota bacterium]